MNEPLKLSRSRRYESNQWQTGFSTDTHIDISEESVVQEDNIIHDENCYRSYTDPITKCKPSLVYSKQNIDERHHYNSQY